MMHPMTNPNESRPDHGEFQVQVKTSDEQIIIADSIRKASTNTEGSPGRYWARFTVPIKADGQDHEIIHMWGVDLIDRTLIIVETEADVELARRQRPLTETEIRSAVEGE